MFQTFLSLFIFPYLDIKILSFFHYFNLINENSDDISTTLVNDNNNNNNNDNNNNNNDNNNGVNEHFTLILLRFSRIKFTHTRALDK